MFPSLPEETTAATNPDTRRSFKALLHKLSKAGFTKDFVQRAILPDWWEDECSHDPRLVRDVEIRIARFLGRPLTSVSARRDPLQPPLYPDAQLRRVRGTHRDRLAPAIHAAIRIATAAVRNLRNVVPAPQELPSDPVAWRQRLVAPGQAPKLKEVLEDLWQRGIPVLPLDMLPTPNFQGMACIVEDRPAIVIGHKHDEPARLAFIIAHEAAHIVAGDCALGRPIVDQEDEIRDDVEMEQRADRYATLLLVGQPDRLLDNVPVLNFKELASHALATEQETGADASLVIFSWARHTHDYATAAMAVKALYRHTGARRKLHQLFDLHVDLTTATETDHSLLRCVHDYSVRHEAAH